MGITHDCTDKFLVSSYCYFIHDLMRIFGPDVVKDPYALILPEIFYRPHMSTHVDNIFLLPMLTFYSNFILRLYHM